jgi:hypothetical protein
MPQQLQTRCSLKLKGCEVALVTANKTVTDLRRELEDCKAQVSRVLLQVFKLS